MRKKGYIEAGVLQYVDDLMYTAEEIGHDIHFIEWLQNIRRWFRMQPKWRVKVAFATAISLVTCSRHLHDVYIEAHVPLTTTDVYSHYKYIEKKMKKHQPIYLAIDCDGQLWRMNIYDGVLKRVR